MISAVESSPSPSSISKIATPKNLLSEVASGSVKVSQNVVMPFLFHRVPAAGLDGAMIVIKHDLRASTTMAGRSARWLEMKTIPEHRTRCTKMTSQEALTRPRAEARRRQQQLESEQTNRPEPHPHFSIKDRHGRVAM